MICCLNEDCIYNNKLSCDKEKLFIGANGMCDDYKPNVAWYIRNFLCNLNDCDKIVKCFMDLPCKIGLFYSIYIFDLVVNESADKTLYSFSGREDRSHILTKKEILNRPMDEKEYNNFTENIKKNIFPDSDIDFTKLNNYPVQNEINLEIVNKNKEEVSKYISFYGFLSPEGSFYPFKNNNESEMEAYRIIKNNNWEEEYENWVKNFKNLRQNFLVVIKHFIYICKVERTKVGIEDYGTGYIHITDKQKEFLYVYFILKGNTDLANNILSLKGEKHNG